MKTIALNAVAAKALDRIAEPHRTQIAEALAAYALGKPSDIKAMQGGKTVRMRVGDYRVIFDEHEKLLEVLAVGHRREIYR